MERRIQSKWKRLYIFLFLGTGLVASADDYSNYFSIWKPEMKCHKVTDTAILTAEKLQELYSKKAQFFKTEDCQRTNTEPMYTEVQKPPGRFLKLLTGKKAEAAAAEAGKRHSHRLPMELVKSYNVMGRGLSLEYVDVKWLQQHVGQWSNCRTLKPEEETMESGMIVANKGVICRLYVPKNCPPDTSAFYVIGGEPLRPPPFHGWHVVRSFHCQYTHLRVPEFRLTQPDQEPWKPGWPTIEAERNKILRKQGELPDQGADTSLLRVPQIDYKAGKHMRKKKKGAHPSN